MVKAVKENEVGKEALSPVAILFLLCIEGAESSPSRDTDSEVTPNGLLL